MKTSKYLIQPLILYFAILWVLANRNVLVSESSNIQDLISNVFFIKLIMTIFLPFFLIYLSPALKPKSGIYFGQIKNSLLIALKSFGLVGPASMSFLIIGILGWNFNDWNGSILVSIFFTAALLFLPKFTHKLFTNKEEDKKVIQPIYFILFISVLAVITALFLPELNLIIRNILYYIFIVAVGEELLFRGYFQSSFNLFFGKNFKIGNVTFGWGLILSSILFGLTHALVVSPMAWPWMLFTFIGGLILGFVREKDGSLLAPIILHILMNFPLILSTL